MNRFLKALAALFILALVVSPAFSWLPQFTGGAANADRWDFTSFPVQWNLNPTTGSNVTGNGNVHDIIAASFATWKNAPNTAIDISEGTQSSATAQSQTAANINLICFVCTDADFTRDATTLAVTITTTADRVGEADGHGGTSKFAGQIIKADLLFNPNVTFTTGGTDGESVQVIATHEIGHFLGLDHSAVIRAVMFPYASNLTTLSYDDVAAISTIYPSTAQAFAPATISGRVSLSGSGIFGAHVFAESITGNLPLGGNIRKTPIGTLSTPDGTYTIRGVPTDTYNVTAEPLDDPVTKADVDSYPAAYGLSSLQTNFTTRWH